MNMLENEFERIIETWSDPGDYPSGAGGYPLPDCDVCVGIKGKMVIELEPGDIDPEFDESDQIKKMVRMAELPDELYPESIIKWEITRQGNLVTFIIEGLD